MIDQVQQLLPALAGGSRILLLMSGGVESSTLLRLLQRAGHAPEPFFLDYAQRAATQEWRSVLAQCGQLGIAARRIPMGELGEALGELRPHRFHVPVLYRNLIAISVAASAAGALGIPHICIGITADDAAVDSGSRAETLAPLRNSLAALGRTLLLPLSELTKAEVVALGQDLGVEWNLSYSCLLGRAQHCGVCPQCLKRREAFRRAGLRSVDVQYARNE
ncbi:MAG: 7-cyano-7-deazaguanine synthase [Acidithiobacillus sp.]|nr:7-cyano-7-deazaguanine synthase [Acidithiobacillus sp.]